MRVTVIVVGFKFTKAVYLDPRLLTFHWLLCFPFANQVFKFVCQSAKQNASLCKALEDFVGVIFMPKDPTLTRIWVQDSQILKLFPLTIV